MKTRKGRDSTKHVAIWILGALAGLIGAWIAGHLEKTVGVSDFGYALGFFAAFILFLGMGWMWISVSIAVEEE